MSFPFSMDLILPFTNEIQFSDTRENTDYGGRRHGGPLSYFQYRSQPRIAENIITTTPSTLEKVSSFLGELKREFTQAVESQDFRRHLFYALLGLAGFLALSLIFNNLFKVKDEEDDCEVLCAKLPSYAEVLAELEMAPTEQEYKVNLGLAEVHDYYEKKEIK